jgi:hypothetical protein
MHHLLGPRQGAEVTVKRRFPLRDARHQTARDVGELFLRADLPQGGRHRYGIPGILTADVPAPNDGSLSGIDCLRLNRLARTAGAPIDKGAGIKVFKKIGDPVEKGEPLYRIYTFDQSEYNLAVAATRDNTGYVIDGRQPLRSEKMP